MDVTISDVSNIRTVSRILQCLSKLSDHVQFHPKSPNSLHLRALTPSQSAYAVFRLNTPFFSTITISSSCKTFKLPTRILLPILRAPQQILSLRFRATEKPTRLYVYIRSKLQVKKTFRLPLSEGHVPSIRFDTRTCPNTFQTVSRFFLDALTHFHTRLEEITLVPSPQLLILQSFVDDVSNPANVILRTELTIDVRELERYVCTRNSPTPLTICYRYFRAILEFCDPIPAPLGFWYDQPGRPVLIDFTPIPSHIGDEIPFDAHFVFASRLIDESPDEHQVHQQEQQDHVMNDTPGRSIIQGDTERVQQEATIRRTYTKPPTLREPHLSQRPPDRVVPPPTETPFNDSDPHNQSQQNEIRPTNRILFDSESGQLRGKSTISRANYETPPTNRDSDPYQSVAYETPARSIYEPQTQNESERRDSLSRQDDDEDDDDFVDGTPPPD